MAPFPGRCITLIQRAHWPCVLSCTDNTSFSLFAFSGGRLSGFVFAVSERWPSAEPVSRERCPFNKKLIERSLATEVLNRRDVLDELTR